MENKELVQIDVSYVDKIAGGLTTESIEELEVRCKALTIKGVDDKIGFKHVYEARQVAKEHIRGITKRHKIGKSKVLGIGRMFDGEKNRLLELLNPIRNGLQEKENVIVREKELFAAEKQREKQEAHEERIKELTRAGAVYDFSLKRFGCGDESFTDNDIWSFDEQNYNLLLSCVKQWKESEGLKKAEDERKRREQAEKQKEIEAENLRIREELEQGKKEREEEETKLREEREAFEKDKQDVLDAKKREEAEKKTTEEARLQAIEETKLISEANIREAERLEEEEKEVARRIEEAEKKAKKQVKEEIKAEVRRLERESIKEKEKLAELEAQKPDKDRLETFVNSLKFPEMKTDKYQKIIISIKGEIQGIMNFVTAE